MRKITFVFALLCAMTVFSQRTAKNYLIQLGSGTPGSVAWTKTLGASDSIVDLTTEAKSLTAWLTSRTSWLAADQIWIAAGNYAVASSYNIGASPSATTFPSVICGGFNGTENSLAARVKGTSPWSFTNATIIDGTSSTANGIFQSGAARVITIDGLTFTNCPATAAQVVSGRVGMTIQNCTFSTNSTLCVSPYVTAGTGGLTAMNVTNCYFDSNTSALTSATCVSAYGNATYTINITGCTFNNNKNTGTGNTAAACVKTAGAQTNNISVCTFTNNSTTSTAATSAVSLGSTVSNLVNCLLINNTGNPSIFINSGNVMNCTVVGSPTNAIYVNNATAANVNLANSVFWGTTAGGGSLLLSSTTAATIKNCAYFTTSRDQTPAPANCVTLTAAQTGIFTDPTNNNWSLVTGSPLIDAGTATGAPATDITGMARPKGAGYEIGAYEFDPIVTKVNSTQSTSIACASVAGKLSISGLSAGQEVAVFAVTGSKVATQKAAAATIQISVSRGIYVVKAGSATAKVVVL